MDHTDPHLDRVFQALAHPVRRDILLRTASEARSISALAAPFDMTLEAVSQHVRVLERAGLLDRSRQGRVHRCRMDPAPLHDAAEILARLGVFWSRRFDALGALLGEAQPAPPSTSSDPRHDD